MAAQTGLKDSSRSQSCIAKRSPFPLLFRSAAKLTAGIHFRPNWNWIANRDEYWLRTDVKPVWHVLNRATPFALINRRLIEPSSAVPRCSRRSRYSLNYGISARTPEIPIPSRAQAILSVGHEWGTGNPFDYYNSMRRGRVSRARFLFTLFFILHGSYK